ncbi:MAG: stage II sporulation protein P [Oscillospiraceae bacterium]|nr:stage II sporulation protein P [Oscillospiraceae bacterium]
MTMTIRRRPRRGRLAAALVLAGAVLYLVAATAGSSTVQGALERLGRQGDLALAILRCQLGGWTGEDGLPPAAALCIGQSPVLLSGREAVLGLWQSVEEDDSAGGQEVPEKTPPPSAAPLPEEPVEPEAPLEFPDNGVAARTLSPSSPEGYLVAGDVYINNRSDLELDASIFHETFAAALAEEEGPQVLIVHTHGSEAYTMPPGQEYVPSGESRTTDSQFNVVRVGDEIAAVLEAAGLEVLHDAALHDYPEYSGAYGRSLETVERYLEEYPTIRFVLDVHRDAISDGDGSPYKVISSVDGHSAAQMSFVIGTDGGGLEHPQWRENLKFAAAVQQELAERYPTLMRPITVRNSRYNQHTTTGSLLVEMGAAGNSLDEALLSARLLGEALAEVILETGAEAQEGA